MKKALKITGKILLGILILFAVFLLGLGIYNKIKSKNEAPLLEKTPGQFVEVDGARMNVCTVGEGKHTLVMLAGWATSCPVYDFRAVSDRLKDDYRLVIIEKFGYGFSDIVDGERSVETMLRQDREALDKAGITGPYVLCPHSMGGLEALYWAQKYPEEVEAFIGLDPAVPDDYLNYDAKKDYRTCRALGVLSGIGATRVIGVSSSIDKEFSDRLSPEELEIFKALIYKNSMNVTLANEGLGIPDACEKINSLPKPQMPMLIFSSNGKNAAGASWVEAKKNYAAGADNIELVQLDCAHDVQNLEPEKISEKMKEFLAGLDK